VVTGSPNMMGGPDGAPEPADPLPDPAGDRAEEGKGLVVGVCDTGIAADAASAHPSWLGPAYVPEADDEDPLYIGDDLLGLQGGHGTFVAGMVRQAAPGVALDPERALDADGLGDEEMLAGAVSRLGSRCPIVNLSLGCFTQDDQPSLPIQSILDQLDPEVLVVAAAGNAGLNRPYWPAAFDRVIGVASVVEAPAGLAGAPYSNHGPWVDACAYGDRISTYVEGRLLIPGEQERTYKHFARWQGTSFAAPYVAGRIAAAATKNGISPRDAAAALLDPALRFGDYGVLVG
jgi:subtilisin family serine protease